MTYFLFLDNIEKKSRKIKEKLYVLENGAFPPKEQMLHFP